MAEFILKDLVDKAGLADEIYIESAATSMEEYGNDMYYLAKQKLTEEGIPFSRRSARQITKKDYDKFDFIIGTEERNIDNILRILGEDNESKVSRLLDFTETPKDIADPWFTGNFDVTYCDVVEGCQGFLRFLEEN